MLNQTTGAAARAELARVRKTVVEANRSDVARRTGISLSGVSRILSGHRTASTRNLDAIATVLDLSMESLYRYLKNLQLSHVRRHRRGGTRGGDVL